MNEDTIISPVNTAADAARLQNFAGAAVLTGFQNSVINPLLDPIDLKQLYLDTADAEVGSVMVDQLLQEYLALQAQGLPKQEIANTLLGAQSPTPTEAALLAGASSSSGISAPGIRRCRTIRGF